MEKQIPFSQKINHFLIAFEGIDGSGKETQSKLLEKKLRELGQNVERISFPDYSSRSSAPIQMIFDDEVKKEKINPKQMSMLFAVDRFLSFQKEGGWKSGYENGIVITDRYTTSNILYQVSRLKKVGEKMNMMAWVDKQEYIFFGIPKPDIVFFLSISYETSKKLRENRPGKMSGNEKLDSFERDEEYLKEIHDQSIRVAQWQDWVIIDCEKDGELLPMEEISQKIMDELIKRIKNEK